MSVAPIKAILMEKYCKCLKTVSSGGVGFSKLGAQEDFGEPKFTVVLQIISKEFLYFWGNSSSCGRGFATGLLFEPLLVF